MSAGHYGKHVLALILVATGYLIARGRMKRSKPGSLTAARTGLTTSQRRFDNDGCRLLER